MQRKPALITENIKRLTSRILRRCGIVLTLIEKRPGLLPSRRLVNKSHPIHLKFGSHLTLCINVRRGPDASL